MSLAAKFRQSLIVGLACLAAVAGSAPRAGAEPAAAAPVGAPAASVSRFADWGAPMRLGHPDPAARTDAQPLDLDPAAHRVRCRRWRAMADQLGETYAGYALRTTVIRRNCDGPVGSRREDAVWDWPWAVLAAGRAAPPRFHRAFGAWHVRCGVERWRHRCAAMAVVPSAQLGGDPSGPKSRSLVTHFVIDMVAGRESVLWRVFVPAASGSEAAVPAPAAGTRLAGVPVARDGNRWLRYRLNGKAVTQRFVACAQAGCIMESDLVKASDAATVLWDGAAIDVEIAPAEGESFGATIPGGGFREALRELIRLRREEHRSAGR
jgi:invasion protein IalB